MLQNLLRFSSAVAPGLIAAELQRAGTATPAASPADYSLADSVTVLGCVTYFAAPRPVTVMLSSTHGTALAQAGILPEHTFAEGDLGSPAALQLFGLLCSILKLGNTNSISNLRLSGGGSSSSSHAGLTGLQTQVCSTSGVLSALSAAFKKATATPVQAEPRPSNSSSTGSANNSRSMLPWLMLLGRCCLATAAHMHAISASTMSSTSQGHPAAAPAAATRSSSGPPTEQQAAAAAAAMPCPRDTTAQGVLAQNLVQWRVQLSAAVLQCLQVQDTAQRLATAGYKIQALQQQLQAAAQALESQTSQWTDAQVVHAAADIVRSCSNPELLSLLQAVGIALNNSCPVPYACNNPVCSNMSGPSEAQLVSGRSCICAGCFTAHYCSRACQKAHCNKQHSPVCKAIAAAAAAAAGEPADAVSAGNGV